MNIAIFSYNFLPQADAEAFCATRFASALARAGNKVTVITMDWPMQVTMENYVALVAKELNIVRIPFSKHKNTPLKGMLWYGHKSQMAVDVSQSTKAVKKVLMNMDNPILLTRSMPIMSAMVGLRTYKYASKWIAHFSDPAPWTNYANTLGHKILRHLELNIIRKTFKKANGISLTCEHVKKYFNDVFGHCFDSRKAFITTHIGDYRLSNPVTPILRDEDMPILMHPGQIYADRGGNIIVQIMKEFESEGYKCRFVQVGKVDKSIIERLRNLSNIEIYDTSSLEKNIELGNQAKAILIPDFNSPYSYSPFLLSKFVYKIMDNQPLVIYSKEDSAMHDYAVRFPNAGIFWANNKDSLKEAIRKAMECDPSTFDRQEIRNCFSEKTIVDSFITAISSL